MNGLPEKCWQDSGDCRSADRRVLIKPYARGALPYAGGGIDGGFLHKKRN
ncbi:hypothetical protein RCH06_002176 [Polaromonas sp. CG_9.5]|nr:hypothetical protein [Polaromonas sp. CG_9.5]